MYAVTWETSFSINGKEAIIINWYAPGCVFLESIYFTAYKTLTFGMSGGFSESCFCFTALITKTSISLTGRPCDDRDQNIKKFIAIMFL